MPENSLQPVERATVLSFTRMPARPDKPTVLQTLDWLSLVMDRLFEIPGTRLRFGLNSILLLIPILGDVIPTLVSAIILAVGLSHHRVPRIVAARMMLNSMLDAAIGWVPIFGDLFDLWFKADTRNVRLLMQYAGSDATPPPSTWRHWLFVLGALVSLLLVLTLVVVGAIALIHWLVQAAGHAA
jgi:hypothetical protein